MNVFEDIKTGLNQAIDCENGKIPARTTILQIAPIESFTPTEFNNPAERRGRFLALTKKGAKN